MTREYIFQTLMIFASIAFIGLSGPLNAHDNVMAAYTAYGVGSFAFFIAVYWMGDTPKG